MELTWHDPGSRVYETGVCNVALYLQRPDGTYENGVAWNGVISVTGSPSGGEPSPIVANNIKIGDTVSATDFGGRIEAYAYPDIFAACEGIGVYKGVEVAMQKRRRFGLVYKTLIGNDVNDLDNGYKLHIHYGCRVQPTPYDRMTMGENMDLLQYSWNFTSLPVHSNRLPPLTYICVDSTKLTTGQKNTLNWNLFGMESGMDPHLLIPDQIANILDPL